jgi:pimeloyl-ACP methyl ester carboxylesterase
MKHLLEPPRVVHHYAITPSRHHDRVLHRVLIDGMMMKAMAAVLSIAVACLLFLAAVFLWQGRLLYFPAQTTVERVASGGLHAWPSSQDFRGLVAEPTGAVRGTAIVFHGNAGHVGHRAFYAHTLTPLGLRVILAEYPGYGPRTGKPGEASLVTDAAETLALAHRQYGGPLLVIGESLGAAVAAAAGSRQPDLTAGLVLITPWDRLAHVGSHHYPWLPVKWLLRDEYDSLARLAKFERPVIVAVAERDSIVPAQFGTALHTALTGPKRLVVMEGSEHNDWPDRVDAAWWRAAIDFALGDKP